MHLTALALPLLQTLPPEAAHHATLKGLRLGIGLPRVDPGQWNTAITLPKSGLRLQNPVGLAAGFDKNAEVHRAMARLGFGYIECGSVTPKPQAGNPKPRLFRLPEDGAVINRLGFNNYGLDYFTRRLRRSPPVKTCPVGANVGANKTSADFIADYETGIKAVRPFADYITINISSPNTPGLRSLQGKTALSELLIRCQSVAQSPDAPIKPVFLKIAPDLTHTDIDAIFESLNAHGDWLSGLILSNTTLERPNSLQNAHKRQTGGLSGAPLRDKALAVLALFAAEFIKRYDLIGCGGISNGAEAYARLRAGASAVQLYTALIYGGVDLVRTINADIATHLRADGFTSVADAIGADLR